MCARSTPDGRVVKTSYNGAARPTQLTFDSFNGGSVGYKYVGSAGYAPGQNPCGCFAFVECAIGRVSLYSS